MIRIPRLSELLLISSVFGVGISYGDVYLFHILFALLILQSLKLFLKSSYKVNLKFFSKKYIYFLPLLFSWYFITIFWSLNKLYTIQYLFYLFCGIGIVFIISVNFNTKEKLSNLLNSIGLVFCLEIFFSLLEALTAFRLPISPFSNYVTYFGRNPSLQPTLDSYSIPSLLQPPTGFQWNPNDLAITMIMLIPFFIFSKKNFIKWTAVISIFIIIIMTSSRTVLLSIILLFLIYLIFYRKQFASLVLIFLVSIAFFSQLENLKNSENPQISEVANAFSVIQNLISDDILTGQSLSIRKDLAINGFQALKSTYGIGVGGGGSIAVQEKIGGVDGRITSMHNFWVEVMVDAGILFSMLFFIWYLSLAWYLYKMGIQSKSSETRYLGKSISLCLIIFVPAAVSASSVIYFFPMWLMLGFGIAAIEVDSKTNSQEFASSFLLYFPTKNSEHSYIP